MMAQEHAVTDAEIIAEVQAGSTPGAAFGSARQYRDGERPLAS
jgi:hypothetical protein